MKRLSLLTLIAAGLWTAQSCQSGNHNNADASAKTTDNPTSGKFSYVAVAPPLQGVDVPFKKLTVNATNGGVLRLENGTKINVPANAFTNAAGQIVSGDVELQYREFHDAADLLASGIIMHDPETGVYMQTAGMFELVGNQGGEAVNIAEGKTVNVDMASYVNDGTEFDFFYLKKDEAKWDKLGTCPAKPNLEKEAAIKRVQERMAQNTKPIAISKSQKGNFVFNLDVDYDAFPELKAFSGVIWEYAGNKEDAEHPQKNPAIFETDWSEIKLIAGRSEGEYMLSLKDGKVNATFPVRPVMTGKNYETANADFKKRMDKYNNIVADIEREKSRVEQEGDVMRTFGVKKFGIYNWDVCNQPGRVQCSLALNFQGTDMSHLQNKMTYFLITAQNRSLIRYSYEDLTSHFSYNPTQKNLLVAVLPDNHLAVCNYNDFYNLNAEQVAASHKANLTMKALPNAIKDMKDLQETLETFM